MTRSGALDYLRQAARQVVETEGLRPFALRSGIPLGQLRSLLQGRASRSTTLELIAAVLGLEFYIGPARVDSTTEPKLPPEIAEALHVPREASIADAVGAIDRGTLAAKLREGISMVQELLDRAAEAAALIPDAGPAEPPAGHLPRDRAVATIPFAPDVRLAAGKGEVVFEEATEVSIAVAIDALASWARPEHLICVRATGDSMEPTIHDGDLVAIDSSATDPLEGGLFALRTDAGLVVKRLRQTGGRWLLTSDNPAHAPRTAGEDDRVLGRIAWCAPRPRRHR